MEFSFQQFICKQKSNLRLKINEGHYESDKFFFSKNYPSFQADIFRRRKNSISIMLYSISHIVTYTPCSTYYLTSSTNWTPHLMENSIREPKIFLLSIFLRMKLCTCSKTSFSSDCDRFVFLKSKKIKYINYWTDYWMILTVTRI